ncbi:DNA-binding protein [Mycoplasma ovis str. Michigan]|uniref:DNA-binding protein n=1 Tax=Mycoplasma ovis str. Michigan TaxID=1415773 RepID=A0ABM5P0T7_9MOLU|nr:HU family DNA-binding protein [Mycoplasma ovis]AHC40007.1 DNA-binding protein [Mycoplasma ovis str. Michigan]
MKKKELLDRIATKVGCTYKTAQNVLSEFQYAILEELKKTGSVVVLGIGQIKVAKRSARQGVNPITKMKMEIPAKEVPKLVASKKLKELVNGETSDIYGSFEY